MPKSTFYAYKLEVPDGNTTSLLEAIIDVVKNPKKFANIFPYKSYKIAKNEKYVIGCLLKNQMTNLPMVVDGETLVSEDLNFDENKGLGHPTIFLYYPKLDFLFIESNRPGDGVLLKSFLDFFAQQIGVTYIASEMVIDPQALAKFASFTRITKFVVKIARLEKGTIFHQRNLSVGKIIEYADDSNSNTLFYEIRSGIGKHRRLNLELIKSSVRELLKLNKEIQQVETLKITGAENEEQKNMVIDLIQDRFKLTFSTKDKRNIDEHAIGEKISLLEIEFLKYVNHLSVYERK